MILYQKNGKEECCLLSKVTTSMSLHLYLVVMQLAHSPFVLY